MIGGVATLAAYVGVWAGVPLALVFAPALLVGAAAAVGRGRPDEDAVRLAAVTLFPLLYLAVPLGLAAALHTDRGPMALLVPFLVVVASDSAQYYGGRTMSRHAGAARISPKKTVEGAGHRRRRGRRRRPAPFGPPHHPDADRPDGAARRADRDHRHHGRPVRVAAQARQRHQGFVEPDPGTRRHPRSSIDALLFVFPAYALFTVTPACRPMASAPMRLAILGSTGSIGHSALAVVEAHADRLQVIGLAAGTSAAAMAPTRSNATGRAAVMATDAACQTLRAQLPTGAAAHLDLCGAGPQALIDLVTRDDVDTVLCASSGTAALEAVVAADQEWQAHRPRQQGSAGDGRPPGDGPGRAHGVDVLPVDSEHNAIRQCLHRRDPSEVRRLILTASGGPFRHLSAEALAGVTVDAALSHPTWRMGRKITIDSATLMNKGLEVIEAHWLFQMPPAAIDVVVHPQSVVHSLVELTDGSIIAQLGVTDMRLPIQYASRGRIAGTGR